MPKFPRPSASLTETHEPSQNADLRDLPSTAVNEVILRAGYRARLLVPLVRSGNVVGALVVRRKAPGEFPTNTVELLKTFAAQAVLAIENVRLFARNPGQEPPARGGEPAQVAVPRQHEPRAAHAAQRHHRRQRDAAGGCGGAKAGHSSRSTACSARAGTCSP